VIINLFPVREEGGNTKDMEIIGLIIAGLIVGLLGRLLHPGSDHIGLLATLGIGVAAVVVVGLLLSGPLGFLGYVLAVVVAALLVALWSRMTARSSGRLA
jgi:uncharacterized membrane protein YeaQ/YmgE (transglycosylase-associated protein family)